MYWDKLATILPFEGFAAWHGSDELGKELAALDERFLRPLIPTSEQKAAVHTRVAALLREPPPPWLRPAHLMASDEQATLWAGKLSPSTLALLETSGWLTIGPGEEAGAIAPAAANLVLAALAEECSSPTLPPITADVGAFRASCNTLLAELQAPAGLTGPAWDVSNPAPTAAPDPTAPAFLLATLSQLAPIPGTVGPRELGRLRKLRDDPDFDGQREAFCTTVDHYLKELSEAPPQEVALVVDDWAGRLKRDKELLRRDLRRAKLDAIIDKDGIVALVASGGLAAGGVVAAGVIGGPIGAAIGLGVVAGRGGVAYERRKREVLDQHWTAWLYSVEKGL